MKAGLAWYFRQYERDVPADKRGAYAAAEAEARQARRGLWSHQSLVPPWEFRHPDQGESSPTLTNQASGKIVGNRNSNIYHLPNCPDYGKVLERNRMYFENETEAVRAGFRKARNCP